MNVRRGPKPEAEVIAMRAKASAFLAAHNLGDGFRRGYLHRYQHDITREQAAAEARAAAALADQYLSDMKVAA